MTTAQRLIPAALQADAAKTPEQLLAERTARLETAYALGKPDRIPLNLGAGYLVAEMAGLSRELAHDPAAAHDALVAAAEFFQPDVIMGAWHTPKPSVAVGDRSTRWPGYGLGPDGQYQYVEAEFMRASDYDDFLEDPTDWAIRTYLPRVFEKLEPLGQLPHVGMALFGYYHLLNLFGMNAPDIRAAFAAIGDAAAAHTDWLKALIGSGRRMAAAGWPSPPNLLTLLLEAPFDYMSDTLRGMKGIFLDLRQRPDQLLAAQEKALRLQLRHSRDLRERIGADIAFIPLHRGSDGFMSLKQFDRFYWPQFEALVLGLIDLGITPWVYYEGVWDQRLEYLTRFPRGKTVGLFQDSDIFRVKEVVGDTMCVLGGMPVSMLRNSDPALIRDRTAEVCERVGAGGGFVMSTSVMELEGANPELVRVWTDATREFGAA